MALLARLCWKKVSETQVGIEIGLNRILTPCEREEGHTLQHPTQVDIIISVSC